MTDRSPRPDADRRHGPLVLVGVAMAWLAFASPALGQSTDEDRGPLRQEVERRTDDLLAAYRRDDPLGIARVFADDATISGPDGLRVRGREAIDQFWIARSRTPEWTIVTFEVGGGSDTPWQLAQSIRVTTSAGRADTTRTDFLLVWKRGEDGRLRIYYDIYN